jgi:anti-sigma-K factor RskA
MAGKKTQRELEEHLDRLGRELVRASASVSTEAEAVAASPFLYARIRTRINAEVERREAGESWLVLLSAFWRSAPAMALVAVVAFLMFWSAGPSALTPGDLNEEALLGTRDSGIEHVVFADRSALSNDEVLETIFNDERETPR